MRWSRIILPVSLLALFLFYNPEVVFGQKVLMVEKLGRAKHFFYKQDHRIRLVTGSPEATVSGIITALNDTAVTIHNFTTIKLNNITCIEKPRSFWLHSTSKFFAASIAYAVGSMINNWINGAPDVDNTILPVSGSLASLGVVSYMLGYRKLTIGNRWKLKVLDFNNPEIK